MGRHAIGLEDVQREPDGMPHVVIGLTVLFSALLAILSLVMLWADTVSGRLGAIILAVIVLPVLVYRLQLKAARERDHDHPSR